MKKMIFVFLAIIVSLPAVSSVYTTTSQTALRLNDNALLFLITYEFGHEDFAYRMPVLASRSEISNDAVTYDILKDGKLRTMEGQTGGIVLSSARLEEGKYVVKAGESNTFTLVTVLNLPTDRSASSTDYALAISALPFELNREGDWTENQLNESELKVYRTSVIGTDQKLGITTHN